MSITTLMWKGVCFYFMPDVHVHINIRHFLIVALGQQDFLHSTIDEIYEKRQLEYYKAFKESGFYNDLLIQRYALKSELYMRKIAGIVEWCYTNDDYELIYKLIKKGYKYAYNYTQQRRYIDIQDFATAFIKRGGGINSVSEIGLFLNAVVVIYLSDKQSKDVGFMNDYGVQFINGIERMNKECYIYMSKQEYLKDSKEEIDDIYKRYNISRSFKVNTVGKLMDLFIMNEEQEVLKKSNLKNYEELRDNVYQQGMTKYIGALSGWIKTVGFEPMDIAEAHPFNKEELDVVFYEFLNAKEGNNLTDQDQDLFYASCMYLWVFANLYKEAKQLYLNGRQEQDYLNVKEKELILKEKEAFIQKTMDNAQQQMEQMEQKVKRLEEALQKSQKENQILLKENEKINNNEKEVFALRDFIYKIEAEEVEESSLTVEQMSDELKNLKLVVFGGHPNWQNKMKEVLPNTQFIDVDNLNIDISFTDKSNHVFINTTHFNHTFYEKIMGRLNRNNTTFSYLKGYANTKKTLEEMYQKLYQI
jgi:hypothetical protein